MRMLNEVKTSAFRRIMGGLIVKTLSIGVLLGASVWAQNIHPGFTLATIHPNNWSPRVGGMDLLSDGRLVVAEWGVPHNVYIVDNPGTATGGSIQVSKFAMGLDNVLGLKVVDDRIFVLQRQELTELVDTDNDGVADEYININDAFPTHEAMLQFAYDLEYARGSFWAALSADVIVGGYTWGCETRSYCNGREPVAGRSTMWRLNMDGTSETFAGGFRNPNGMGVGLGAELFVTDNQGSWLPSSKIIHVKEGRFYGHRTNPANEFQSAGESPPLAWLPHNEVSLSLGKVIYLKEGRFEGQLLTTETVDSWGGRMKRVFIEEMDGEIQGAVMDFVKGGMESGTQRLVQADDGTLYVGILGSSGGWGGRPGMDPGLQRLRDNGNDVFEVMAVRSLSSTQFAIEFTAPVSSSAGQTSNYTVTTKEFNPIENYGGGNGSYSTINPTSASVSQDGMTVTLTFSNGALREGNLVRFDVGDVRSASGNQAPFTDRIWYTLNNYGPGTEPTVTPVVDNPPVQKSTGWQARKLAEGLRVTFHKGFDASARVSLYDLLGKELWNGTAAQKTLVIPNEVLGKGLHLIRVHAGGEVSHRKILVR